MENVKEAFVGFAKPSIAIDTVILRVKPIEVDTTNRQVPLMNMQVLLVKRHGEKEWHLPGTILRLGETPRDAIKRIGMEKVNVDDTVFEQLYTVADDPMRDERGHIISMVYIGVTKYTNMAYLKTESDYEYEWFWVGKADKKSNNIRRFLGEKNNESASYFKYDHEKIIHDSVERLKGKLLYSDIGFRFLDEKFTIKELENTFNAISERIIPGFRRIISKKVEGTGEMSNGKAFRPAELYKMKPNTFQ